MWVLVALIMLTASPAVAQTVAWCDQPLSFQADPQAALVWRLRCTIQILDRERAEAEDHVTTVETDKALSEAHLKSVQDELGKTKDELQKYKASTGEKKKDK